MTEDHEPVIASRDIAEMKLTVREFTYRTHTRFVIRIDNRTRRQICEMGAEAWGSVTPYSKGRVLRDALDRAFEACIDWFDEDIPEEDSVDIVMRNYAGNKKGGP